MERTRRATIDLFDIRLIADVLSSLTDLHKLRRIDINYKVLGKMNRKFERLQCFRSLSLSRL